jgi:hypothetical protein
MRPSNVLRMPGTSEEVIGRKRPNIIVKPQRDLGAGLRASY